VPRNELAEEERDLFARPNHAVVGTLRPEGSLQVTPVWVDLQGDRVVINSVLGRAKVRNLERDPRVTVTVMDAADWYRWVSVEGRVVEARREGAADHIEAVSQHYTGRAFRDLAPGEVRVMLFVEPERVTSEL